MPKRRGSGKLPSVNRGGLASMAESGMHPTTGNRHQRRIFDKKDLMEAVRQLSPGKRSHSTPALHSKKDSQNDGGMDTSRSSASNTLASKGGSRGGGHPIGSTRKSVASSSGATKRPPPQKDESTGGSTLRALEQGVNMHARRYNELKVQADAKQRSLEKLLDSLHSLEIENTALKNMQSAKTAEAARIKRLRAECKQIQESMENKAQYRAQLDHMHERLTSNVMKFGVHIKAMEEQLRSSRKEHKEVKLLLRQLEQGKTEAVAELASTVKRLEQDRKMRARELSQRQKEAENAKRLEEWREQREKRKLELQAELRGDLSKEEEEELIEKLKKREGQSAKLRAASIDRNKKAMTLEDAFTQIRQATGVTSLGEMVEKFMGQGASKEALLEEKAAAERKLAEVLKNKKESLDKFNAMKAQVAQTGLGGLELNREIYDKLDEEILGAKAELKLNRATCDRLEKSLVAVRQGAKGLAQRLEPFKDLLTHEEEVELPKTDIEALDLLIECEAKLLKMLERLDVDETGAVVPGSPAMAGGMSSLPGSPAGKADPGSPGAGMDSTKKAQLWTPFDNDDPQMHSYNIRIARTRQPGGKLGSMSVGDAGDGSDMDLGIDVRLSGGGPGGGADKGDDDDDDDEIVPDRSELKRKARKTLAVGLAKNAPMKSLGDIGGGKKKGGRSQKEQAEAARRMMGRASPKKGDTAFLTQKPDLL